MLLISLFAFTVSLAIFCCLPLQARQNPSDAQPSATGGKLQEILAQMDKVAAGFTSMDASLEYTKVTVIVNDHSTQKGKIYFDKSGGKTRVMIAFVEPSEKYLLFANGKVSLYQPKIAEVDEYLLAQKQDLVEQFLMLGFGTPGSDLQQAYQVSFRGDARADGQQVSILGLVPKSPKIAAQFQRIELWISPQNWQPVEQQFFEPGGDYVTTRYTNIRWNEKIPDKTFRLPVKGNVKTVHPQGP